MLSVNQNQSEDGRSVSVCSMNYSLASSLLAMKYCSLAVLSEEPLSLLERPNVMRCLMPIVADILLSVLSTAKRASEYIFF